MIVFFSAFVHSFAGVLAWASGRSRTRACSGCRRKRERARDREKQQATHHHFNSFQFNFRVQLNRLGSISILCGCVVEFRLIANRYFSLHSSIRSFVYTYINSIRYYTYIVYTHTPCQMSILPISPLFPSLARSCILWLFIALGPFYFVFVHSFFLCYFFYISGVNNIIIKVLCVLRNRKEEENEKATTKKEKKSKKNNTRDSYGVFNRSSSLSFAVCYARSFFVLRHSGLAQILYYTHNE